MAIPVRNDGPVRNNKETALNAYFAALPTVTGNLTVERRRDGLTVHGAVYIDPEGEIVKSAFDVTTGNATYLARQTDEAYLIRFVRLGTNVQPITLAQVTLGAGGWLAKTASGRTLNGQKLLPTSCGFLVARSNSAFVYSPGNGITNVAAPDGYVIAGFQNGDVASTRHLLVEREAPTNNDNLGQMFSLLNSIASTVGVTRKEDYALVDIDSGTPQAFNIAYDGKVTATSYSNCVQKRRMFNVCRYAELQESLYDNMGMPNLSHYFWRIHWFNTANGPIAVVQENGLADITITDLKTGKKVVAFSRALGINGFSVKQNSDGKIAIVAKLGFSTERMDDALAFLTQAPQRAASAPPNQIQDSPAPKIAN